MHLNGFESHKMYKKKLNNLRKEARHYPQPVCEREGRLVRIWRDNHKGGRYKYYKHAANRFVRRTGERLDRGKYKRVYDFWWNVD